MNTFVLNLKEINSINAFALEHASCKSKMGNDYPNRFSVLSSPTGIADIIKVSCNACGAEKDVSD